MKVEQFENVVRVLNEAKVRYLVVGGIAVVAHGYGRLTFDVDLVVQLNAENIIRAFHALATLGYAPRVPVTAEQFAREENRRRWIEEKDMKVLNMHSERQRDTPIDIFVTEPFDFDATFDMALEQVTSGITFRVVDRDTLIALKKKAARNKDLDDIEHLELLGDDEG